MKPERESLKRKQFYISFTRGEMTTYELYTGEHDLEDMIEFRQKVSKREGTHARFWYTYIEGTLAWAPLALAPFLLGRWSDEGGPLKRFMHGKGW